MSLVINEELCQKLGLEINEEKYVMVANGERVYCKVTEAVEIQWKNRLSILSAVVIPGAKKSCWAQSPLKTWI